MWILTDEQRLIQESARKLLEAEYTFERRRERLGESRDDSNEVWSQFAELGWLGIALPEEAGGFGGGMEEVAILMREFGARLVVEPFVPTVVLGAELIARGAPQHIGQDLIAGVLEGREQLAVAFAEVDSRFDLNRVKTRAQPAANGGYVLTGAKSVVVNAPAADHIIVSARTSGDDARDSGISLFVVPADAVGVTITGYRLNDDVMAGDVKLANVHVTADDLLGRVDGGLELLEVAVDRAIVASCAEAVGAMEAVMDMTAEYIKTREQFGRPIGRNQVLQFRMVDMHFALEESRSMVAAALQALDGEPTARRAMVSAAKVRVGNACRKIGQQGVQLHGAIGMTYDYAVGHYYKRLETLRTVFGDPDFHLARYGRWSQAGNER
jgi:alkylation response protein AidB-like acyl-CoA dehydrogenase